MLGFVGEQARPMAKTAEECGEGKARPMGQRRRTGHTFSLAEPGLASNAQNSGWREIILQGPQSDLSCLALLSSSARADGLSQAAPCPHSGLSGS